MKKNYGKKGVIISSFLIGIIILVASFLVILFLFRLFPFGSSINKETCHQSIVLRSTAKIGPIEPSKALPLKCQTAKICLTISGEDCGELTSTRKNPVQKIRLNKDVQKAREEVMKVFAESMITCHSMLGEGQLNFFPHDISFKDTKYGLICTRIVFDQESKEKLDSIGAGEFFAYLESQITNDQSYLEYLYPGWKNSQNSIKLFEAFKQEDTQLQNVNFVDWKIIDPNQDNGFAIIALISEKGQGLQFAKSAGIASLPLLASGALLASGVGAPVGATLLIGTTASGVLGAIDFSYRFNDEFDYHPPFPFPYNIQILKNAGIYSFEIAP